MKLAHLGAAGALLAALAGPVLAEETTPADAPTSPAAPPAGHPWMGHGMMGHGMGMMGMHDDGRPRCPMQGKGCCGKRHHRDAQNVIRIPRLPPGNEKLQLQMYAEILQRVGEVEAKYAAQLK
jgi:hypothetical protein